LVVTVRGLILSGGAVYIQRNIRCRKRNGGWECVLNIPPSIVQAVFGKIDKHIPVILTVEGEKIVVEPWKKESADYA